MGKCGGKKGQVMLERWSQSAMEEERTQGRGAVTGMYETVGGNRPTIKTSNFTRCSL